MRERIYKRAKRRAIIFVRTMQSPLRQRHSANICKIVSFVERASYAADGHVLPGHLGSLQVRGSQAQVSLSLLANGICTHVL